MKSAHLAANPPRALRTPQCLAILVLLASSLLLGGCLSISPAIAERSAEELGPYPEDYREIAKRWIEDSVPGLSGIESLSVSKPRPGYADALLRFKRYGWFTKVSFRGIDKLGLSKGRIVWALLIRDGKIVARQKRLD